MAEFGREVVQLFARGSRQALFPRMPAAQARRQRILVSLFHQVEIRPGPPLGAALLAFTFFNHRSKRQWIIIRSLGVAIVLEPERQAVNSAELAASKLSPSLDRNLGPPAFGEKRSGSPCQISSKGSLP